MEGREEIKICFILISFLCNAQCLDLSMNRSPGQEVCGHLQCLNDVTKDGNIFTTVEISVYDVTQPDNKIKLASVSMNAGGQYVEHTNSNHINGTGTISRYHAGLNLDFRNETDCLHGSFQCQLDFVNTSGLFDALHKTVTPNDLNNSCTLVSYELMELKAHAQALEEELTRLRHNTFITEDELTRLRHNTTIMEDELTRLRHNLTGLEQQQSLFLQLRKRLEKNFPDMFYQLFPIPCTRGMLHSTSRERFTLWDNIPALCDTETDGGGWVIIQRRTKGDVDFYRNWTDYKNGFGAPDTDFWIGNDLIHNLTAVGYTELRVDLEYNGSKYFAHYSNFSVGDEVSKYKLSVSGYSGTANDSLVYHDGMKLSTFDQDNDLYSENCAEFETGAWWYNSCYLSNLNGEWGKDDHAGVVWLGVAVRKSVTSTEMKIRHV